MTDPDRPIYPGHPVTVAWQIVLAFPSLAAAQAKGHDFPAALESLDIRGAGGCIYSALDFLRYALNPSIGWGRAMEFAEDAWDTERRNGYADVFESGKAQAERIAPRLRERLKTWPTGGVVHDGAEDEGGEA